MKRLIPLLVASTVVTSCAAALVPESSDPKVKLAQAVELAKQQRPIPAERLIREAMELSKERNDTKGLAEAKIYYGILLYSQPYRAYERYWSKNGTYDPTYGTAISYIENARTLYRDIDDPEGQRYAAFQLVYPYLMSGDTKAACAMIEESARQDEEAHKRFPNRTAIIQIPGYKTWAEWTAAARKDAKCD
ncbi:hypothetical protein [Niveibacterium sp. COAC-50]|uniref:hypothetical protein n=1 Tax=Niveibacterium sp. COAC-50 TaxID=2729384 RepID=UPI0015539284|nr:hypothetical protein [Niveibacterium sp. COAC-50]